MADILLIEDDQNVADSVIFVLERQAHTLQHALDANAAKTAMREARFDCIITDVWLGKDNGLDLLAEITKAGETPPCIVISGGGPGRTLENVTTRADVLGAVRMLYKPFGDQELIEAVNAALPDTAK